MISPFRPHSARVRERVDEIEGVFTLRLAFDDPAVHQTYSFLPGQFNMVYLYGVGEVPISIVSDPQDEHCYDHTIRAVGRVTNGLAKLQTGDHIGIRGPYGRGWPLAEAEGKDVMIVTGGIGCAPVVSVINYIMRRRDRFGRLIIMQGVKHSNDLLWRQRYDQWAQEPNTEVYLAADEAGPIWPFHVGFVTELFDRVSIAAHNTVAMMCGPEGMMHAATSELCQRGLPEERVYLSMERNMHCAVGLCGHCQYGGLFVCKDGPVFSYPEVKPLFNVKGF